MDGGNKTPIDLEAGLNITTSDMLVPLSQQTFQHNWQKYQGKFLPNSLRFEKNGWAAGWCVYNFDYNTYRKHENGYYVGLGQLNTYVKTLNIYQSEESYNPLFTMYVVPESVITAGDFNYNKATGKITCNIKGKAVTLNWDPTSHVLSCTDPTVGLEYTINGDYSVTLTVKDLTKSFAYDFTVFTPTNLEGDAISGVSYSGFASGVHSWGQYHYNINTGILTTPEGDSVTPTVNNNQIEFDYVQHITDESANVQYQLAKFYPRFSNITWQDQTNKDKLMIASGSEQVAFNRYKANVTPRALIAHDTDGILIDWTVPLWITASLGVTRTNPNAKYCDNTSNYEIATMQGSGLNMAGVVNNVYTGEGTFTINNAYRPRYPKYIKGLTYRFNQIFLNNTIELSADWDYRKHLLNTQVWYLDSRQYANLRGKRTTDMTKLLGSVYTWGTFSVDPRTVFDYNNPYNASDRTNLVYSQADLSQILSFKLLGTANNNDEGEDQDFIDTNLTLDMSLIATFSGTGTTDYQPTQAAQTLADLYDVNNVYIGTTYEQVGTDDTDFWPFEKVPKFNFTDAGGNTHNGVYWTDGTTIIDDFDTFKAKVLGTRDATVDKLNDVIRVNPAYNRTRVVKRYAAGYDFDFIKKSTYEKESDYQQDKLAWNNVWEKYYPDIQSPQDAFDESVVSADDTYLDYEEITVVSNVDPDIRFVKPGVYIFGTQAIPFNCPSGLIIFNDSSEYNTSVNIWHHATQVDDLYTIISLHEPGVMRQGSSDGINIPFYFGEATSDTLVEGYSSQQFRTRTSRVSLESAKLSMGINYQWRIYATTYSTRIGYDEPVVSHATAIITEEQYRELFEGTITLQDLGLSWDVEFDWRNVTSSYYTTVWSSITPNQKDWLGSLLAYYSSGKVTISNAILNTGVEQVQKYYYVGDINQGIKFGWPIWGHSMSRMTYPDMVDLTHINDTSAFVIEPVPTAELTNDRLVYFDRSDTVKSQHIYDVVENSRNPDVGDGTGNFTFKLDPATTNSFFYYAKKQFNNEQKEILMDYYIPGIAWGDPENETGNMSTSSKSPILEMDWVPMIRRFPTLAFEKFSDLNTKYSQHEFYKNGKSKITDIECILGTIDFNSLTQEITLKFPTGNYVLTYDSGTERTTGPANQVLLTDSLETVTTGAATGTAEAVKIPLVINLSYLNNKARFIKLSDYTLVSSDGDKCVITDGTSTVTYSINNQDTIEPSSGVDTIVTAVVGGQRVYIKGDTMLQGAAYLRAAYDGTITGNIVSFTYHGLTFTWDLAQVIDTGISVLSTDIRTPDKTRVIGKLRAEGQYQLLRQQWNTTVEVENYWWIDATHVLELNQYAFILKRNTKELDDWNGERFEKVFEVGRDKILPTNIIRYFTTNVYKSNRPALFVTAQTDAGEVLLTFYNPRRAFEVTGTQRIRIRERQIGEQLNDSVIESGKALFNTYNPITAAQVLSKAEWSNTIVGNWLIIGCHLGNNYDQWALVINLANFTLSKVVQGYGYVGLHGDLTGGQIPTDYFDVAKGFNSTVQPLSTLKSDGQNPNDLDAAYEVNNVDKINQITAKVVGTSEQQWYISKKLYGIVSHLTFNNGNFTKQILPITNNFAAAYKSPSFSSSVFADSFVQATPFASIFSFEGAANAAWNAFLGLIGYPMVYSIAPRFAQLVYLQQTFGQYAYVHYNASKSLPEQEITNSRTDSGISEAKAKQTDPILSSSFTFDKQKFSQTADSNLSYFNRLMAILIAAFADSLQFLDKKVSMNEEVNTSAVKDAGRKFVDNAVANTSDMLAAAVVSQSKNDSGVTSIVTGLKSLDMFYSTSDQQRVFAGPGFVEHQMVANCIAQSVTDTQVEGKVQQFYFCVRALTTLQIQTTIAIEKTTADWLGKQAESVGQQMVCGTSLAAAGVAMKAAAMALELAIKAQEVALVEIEKVLDAICARGMTVNVDGQVSRHALTIEGKHKYGEKNEVFMWPCFGIQPNQIKYTDEWVECGVRNTPWMLTLNSVKTFSNGLMNMCNVIMGWSKPAYSSNKMGSQGEAISNCGDTFAWNKAIGEQDFDKPGDTYRAYYMYGHVPFYQASAYGKAEQRSLPDDMACIEGVNRFLPNEPFKNENIAVSDPVFASSMIQDFVIDKAWDLAQCATYGLAQWVTVKDTKITNCPPSNMVVNDVFCGVACPYSAIEVKRGIEKAYMRPWAVTPNALAFNCTGYNTILQDKLYHSFDGISYRMVNLIGSPGMNKNRQSFWYSFQVNDRFKRSNIAPANELQGNFESEPVQAVDSIDKLWTVITIASKEKGLEAGTTGEDKDAVRWAVPIFTEPVSTLPACVKTMAASTLAVVDGVTSLVTAQVTDTNAAYKAPLSVDFTIGKNVYRATEEYICSVQPAETGNIITDLIPSLGLKFIGSTPTEAFFYSKATRCYYSFTGAALTKIDMMERFRDIQKGYWDFVNQEVVMPCLMTFKRLNEEVEDTDTETDNIIVPVLSKSTVSGELPPPLTTIFNDRSWYKCVSLPCGFAYQGPNRVIINRAVFCEYMERSVKDNYNKWKKMSRDKYVTHREYPAQYTDVMTNVQGVDGWTYNPFVLVTSALGQSEDADCIFEWNITFCWPIEMDLLYGTDNYACVNICAETMTPGGKKKSEVTHVFLTKELFTRNGSYGYYSFRFQSKNGIGNRERLHIWSDQYIAISSIDCESKVATQRRAEQLTQQIDVQKLKEL